MIDKLFATSKTNIYSENYVPSLNECHVVKPD